MVTRNSRDFSDLGLDVMHDWLGLSPIQAGASAASPYWVVRHCKSRRHIAPPSPCEQVRAGTAPCQLPSPAHQPSRIGMRAPTPIRVPSRRRRRPNPDPGSTTRVTQTAAHLVDHVFPHLPVRQWVLSVPKRLRYFIRGDGAALNSALRIFLRVIEQCLLRHCPGAAKLDKASVHIGAVAFIHRFGSSLNTHVHFHICAIDGVFEAMQGDPNADSASPPGVVFHPASGIDECRKRPGKGSIRTK